MANNAELVFFSKWLKSPLRVASVTPSSAQLARAMAANLPQSDGLVIELGAGTGPITQALLESGVDPAHLIVIERDTHFHDYLKRRFPAITVIRGDAFQVNALVDSLQRGVRTRAVVSGLPLVPMNAGTQHKLLSSAMALSNGAGPFIQFSYGLRSPLKPSVQRELGLSSRCAAQVFRNIPPAKVWVYEGNGLSRPGPFL